MIKVTVYYRANVALSMAANVIPLQVCYNSNVTFSSQPNATRSAAALFMKQLLGHEVYYFHDLISSRLIRGRI